MSALEAVRREARLRAALCRSLLRSAAWPRRPLRSRCCRTCSACPTRRPSTSSRWWPRPLSPDTAGAVADRRRVVPPLQLPLHRAALHAVDARAGRVAQRGAAAVRRRRRRPAGGAAARRAPRRHATASARRARCSRSAARLATRDSIEAVLAGIARPGDRDGHVRGIDRTRANDASERVIASSAAGSEQSEAGARGLVNQLRRMPGDEPAQWVRVHQPPTRSVARPGQTTASAC